MSTSDTFSCISLRPVAAACNILPCNSADICSDCVYWDTAAWASLFVYRLASGSIVLLTISDLSLSWRACTVRTLRLLVKTATVMSLSFIVRLWKLPHIRTISSASRTWRFSYPYKLRHRRERKSREKCRDWYWVGCVEHMRFHLQT